MLPKSGPIGDVNVDFDISQVGLLRIPLYEVLVRKLRGHIENLTREVATMSLEEAVTIFEFLAISMNITYSFGVLSVVDIVGIRRSFNPSLATLLARTSRTGQDREFIETYSSNQEVCPVSGVRTLLNLIFSLPCAIAGFSGRRAILLTSTGNFSLTLQVRLFQVHLTVALLTIDFYFILQNSPANFARALCLDDRRYRCPPGFPRPSR